MKKGWNTTKLVAAGSLGVLTLILQLLGAGISGVVGFGWGGIINTVLGSVMVIICLLVVKRFGATMVMYSIFSIWRYHSI